VSHVRPAPGQLHRPRELDARGEVVRSRIDTSSAPFVPSVSFRGQGSPRLPGGESRRLSLSGWLPWVSSPNTAHRSNRPLTCRNGSDGVGARLWAAHDGERGDRRSPAPGGT